MTPSLNAGKRIYPWRTSSNRNLDHRLNRPLEHDGPKQQARDKHVDGEEVSSCFEALIQELILVFGAAFLVDLSFTISGNQSQTQETSGKATFGSRYDF